MKVSCCVLSKYFVDIAARNQFFQQEQVRRNMQTPTRSAPGQNMKPAPIVEQPPAQEPSDQYI